MNLGGCLCGQIKYRIDGDIGDVVHCHCKTCQKAHSAAFSSVAAVADSNFNLVSGTLKNYESSKGKFRYFCGDCGSQIYAKRNGTQHMVLRMGSLDSVPNVKESSHIWLSQKASWYEVTSDLPQHQEFE
ncbi:GFA family protein [Vibrio vulnificus]|nr:GFA family protein [Vibrio vulnificus]EHH1182905.1 GFA family protein [Vibrio vulnificus]EHH1191756.1 GFA family protein [Vibrio vulnificus]EIA1304790.1 GFA family protein [Vibrio vulnificus]EIV8483647.1 GFA family protein [Vibrio vulnificus]